MTSFEFERVSKKCVCAIMKEKHDIDLTVFDLDFVWFNCTLRNMKCMLYSKLMGQYYAEVTYRDATKEMIVDIYSRSERKVYASSEISLAL